MAPKAKAEAEMKLGKHVEDIKEIHSLVFRPHWALSWGFYEWGLIEDIGPHKGTNYGIHWGTYLPTSDENNTYNKIFSIHYAAVVMAEKI